MKTQNPTDPGIRTVGRPLVLYVFSCLYALLYLLFIIGEGISFKTFNLESASVLSLFLFYLTAFVLSWFREKTAGYMFVSWYVLMMALAIHIWTDAGMTIIMGFPLLPIGAFYVLYAYKKSLDTPPEVYQQWSLVLRLLISAYAAIYIIGMVDNFTGITEPDFISEPYQYLTILLAIFLIGFGFSWKNELISGIILALWYLGILVLLRYFPGLPNKVGPMRLLGFPILVQGFLYILYWFIIRPEKPPNSIAPDR